MVAWGVGYVWLEDEAVGSEGRELGSIQSLECFDTIARNLDFILDFMGSH